MTEHLPACGRGPTPRPRRRPLATPCLLLALASPVGALAQVRHPAAATAARDQVILAVVSRMAHAPAGDVALVRRSPAGADTVFVSARDADGESIAAAVFVLLSSRQLMGNAFDSPMTLRVPARRVPAAWKAKDVARAAKVLARARTLEPRELPGWGTARVIPMLLTNRRVLSHIRPRS